MGESSAKDEAKDLVNSFVDAMKKNYDEEYEHVKEIPACKETSKQTWAARCKEHLEKGQYYVACSNGKFFHHFACHVRWLNIGIKPSGGGETILFRLNFFCMLPKEGGEKGEGAIDITSCAQLVVLNEDGIGLKGVREHKGQLKYDKRFLRGEIKSWDEVLEALKDLLDKQESYNASDDSSDLLLNETLWRQVCLENGVRRYFFKKHNNGSLNQTNEICYKQALEEYEEFKKDEWSALALEFGVDEKTLNIHPPESIIEETIEKLQESCSQQSARQ